MSLREMRLSDLQLRDCTRWVAPDGVVYLPQFHVQPFFKNVPAGQTLDDVELGTPPEFPFLIKLICSTGINTSGVLVRIQWPDGRYLSNPGVDFFSFVGTGRRGRLLDKPKVVPPSSKIRFDLTNPNGADADLEIFFEGALLVPLVNA
jgi:hypothetical protein